MAIRTDLQQTMRCKSFGASTREHPSHAVFNFAPDILARRLPWTIPFSLHGDGGRTQKKEPLNVVSFEPTVGIQSATAAGRACRCPQQTAMSTHRLNQREHSYLTRFLLLAYPTKRYPKALLQEVLAEFSEQLAALFRDGVRAPSGVIYFMACLGQKGELEFHCQSAQLDRSFMNLGTRNMDLMCLECEAGREDCPYEDCNVGASWEATAYKSLPWTTPPRGIAVFQA